MPDTAAPRYLLCRQTVTLYHPDPAARTVTRTVLRDVFLDHRRRAADTARGPRDATSFVLIVPQASARWGEEYTLAPHDRVLDGEGPEVAYEDWLRWLPAQQPGLCVVQYVDLKTIAGSPCHIEAGGYWTESGTGAHSLTN